MIATIKKVLVSFAMLIFLLPFSPHKDSILPLSDTPEAKAASIIYTTTANLNLRSGSSTKHTVLTVIPKGRQVSLLSNHGSWYKIRFANKTGYASSAYLKPASTVTDSIKYATTANLNLRTGAGTKYKVLIVIPKGKQVSLLSRHGTWYRVKYSTKSGYVSSDYLRKIQSPANQDSAKLTVKNGITYVDGIIIVNKRYSLPSSYNPGESKEARAAFNRMAADAGNKKLKIQVISGFRSYAYQKNLYNRYVKTYGEKEASRFSAKPGHSEHQTGLAFDIGGPSQTYWLKQSFDKTAEGKYLADNAHCYGFIMRYPTGKEAITGYMYEPWHFRYVGVKTATKIYNSKKTMEEYYSFTGK